MMLGLVFPKGAIRYTFMPEVVGRIQSLVFGGFQHIPFFIALVYHVVRLLPANHPYLKAQNIGRFGIRHVVAEAANNIVISRKNIDQMLLFVLILLGLGLMFLQLCLLGMALLFQPLMAAPTNWNDFFVVNPIANRQQDLAFIMLDLIFGVPYPTNPPGVGVGPGFFESCVGDAAPCEDNFGTGIIDTNNAGTVFSAAEMARLGPLSSDAYLIFPFPFHLGLHALFAVYSQGLLVVAVIIASYFIATILAETAQSGTAFGRRFNKMWAPIRLVMAFGLLMPLTVGLNSSQYLVLYAAKFGSAFATNGWQRFNTTLTTSYLGNAQRLITTPTIPDVQSISQFLFVARTCKFVYAFVKPSGNPTGDIRAYLVGRQTKTPNAVEVDGVFTYQNAINFMDPNPTVFTVRFGERDPAKYPHEQGNVKPYCGEMQFSLTDPRDPSGANPPEPGTLIMQEFFFHMVRDMWNYGGGFNYFEGGAVATAGDRAEALAYVNTIKDGAANTPNPPGTGVATNIEVTSEYVSQVNQNIRAGMLAELNTAVTAQLASVGLTTGGWTGDPVARKGWAAAGIWYNRVAELNGTITAMVRKLPTASLEPYIMAQVRALRAQYNKNSAGGDRFDPVVAGVGDTTMLLQGQDGQLIGAALNVAYKTWSASQATTQTVASGNPFIDMINSIIGTSGLFDMRQNADAHPLAQLVGIGRSLVESSLRNIQGGMLVAFGGAALGYLSDKGTLGQLLAGGASTAASFMFSVAMIGLTAGFVLYYIVPFLPFIYFFFAVGGWVKGIFEAMVGAPLWALAHIRIDAHGLPGNAALNGYFLIFEIFLRPILIVFGLLASISIFSALVQALHSVFDLVVSNATGFNMEAEVSGAVPSTIDKMRGPIDEFFFTIIYAIIVYMMGMSSFKLIDTIPNNILRWMGQSVATFGDQREDPAQGLTGRAAFGAQQTLAKVDGGLQGLAALGKNV